MKCNLRTVNDWCGIFNKSCKECISPMCKFIKKAYRQGRVEAEYFSCYKPEIIKCKNCRHDNNCEIQYAAQAGSEFFCGAAERSN